MIPSEVRALNRERCLRWHPPETDDWTLGDWAAAMCSEAGEAAGVVKKIRRHQSGLSTRYNTPPLDVLLSKFMEEVADTLLYLDLLCWKVGVTPDELDAALVEKFNRVSRIQGWDDLTVRPTESERPQPVGRFEVGGTGMSDERTRWDAAKESQDFDSPIPPDLPVATLRRYVALGQWVDGEDFDLDIFVHLSKQVGYFVPLRERRQAASASVAFFRSIGRQP